jgi:hypothetical protein
MFTKPQRRRTGCAALSEIDPLSIRCLESLSGRSRLCCTKSSRLRRPAW